MSEGWSEETRARLESLARNTAMRGAGAIESNDWVGDKLLDDAADIRAALAEIERLTRERDEARSRVSSLETQWAESDTAKAIFQAMERAEQAEAQVERLRAEVERLRGGEVHAMNAIRP